MVCSIKAGPGLEAHAGISSRQHSDFLNELGPRPIIVGLSLGASRRFDLTEMASDGAAVRLMLPHNSALIMWNDAQERWLHAVPRCADSSVGRHPLVGLERISLTFRMKRADLPILPRCRCGVPAALKARGQQYWLFCDPSRAAEAIRAADGAETEGGGAQQQRTQCGFRHRCEWAEREAARLRTLESRGLQT